MDNQELAAKKPKSLKIIIAVSLLLIAAIVFLVLMNKNKSSRLSGQQSDQQLGQQVASASKNQSAEKASNSNDNTLATSSVTGKPLGMTVITGANIITPENLVVTKSGALTVNSAIPMSDNAPKQTGLLEKATLSNQVLKIDVGNNKFSPKEFTIIAGAPTTFSLTSVDDLTHIISFDDPALSAIAVLVGSGQTKGITFNAPAKPGSYTFRCVSPGHADKGEVGVMIVK